MSYLKLFLQYSSLCVYFAFLVVEPTLGLPSLTSTATTKVKNLTLDGRGSASTHIVKVADLILSTDNPTGLTLFASSGSLTKSEGSPIAYQVTTVEDGAAPPSASDFSSSDYTISLSTPITVNKDLYIKYTPAPLQDPGTYNAAISLIVTDN